MADAHPHRVIVACGGKFHAFHLAEQLARHGMLERFFTHYASQKTPWLAPLAGRRDGEAIPPKRIQTHPGLAVRFRFGPHACANLRAFDRWVARRLSRLPKGDIFIGWSSMSLEVLHTAKRTGRLAILERGSTHILHQARVCREAAAKLGLSANIDDCIIERELAEYDAADHIVVPSTQARDTFVAQGVPEKKVQVMPLGAADCFFAEALPEPPRPDEPLRLLYLGRASIRKGFHVLLEALERLDIAWQLWHLGATERSIQRLLAAWPHRHRVRSFGHLPLHRLPPLMRQCHLGVQPSFEEGMSMVVLQYLAVGLPIAVTPATGAADVVPPDAACARFVSPGDADALAAAILSLAQNADWLALFEEARHLARHHTWQAYGHRYVAWLKTLAS